jgi:hypothetical protein
MMEDNYGDHPFLPPEDCEYFEKKITAAFRDLNLPDHMLGGILRYVFCGIEAGSFMHNVLKNDFLGACTSADSTNQYKLRDWAMLFHYLPRGCWGSEELVTDWMKGFKRGDSI